MNFKTFVIGLAVAFGVPWVFALALPYAKMTSLEPVEFDEIQDERTGVYESKRVGRLDGAKHYAANGCASCHTQLIRPTYAGNEIHRKDWAGQPGDPANGVPDTRRETNPFDYDGEEFAFIGQTRIGPDLSNVAIRAEKAAAEMGISTEQWFLRRLYDPNEFFYETVCPPMTFMFKEVDAISAVDALPYEASEEGMAIVPKSQAESLVGYLLSLRKDEEIPANLDPRAKSAN
ncbi:MAG: hypothetical protein Q7Q71_00610 [Verrucomicrobiota bacterium JB023]|nr:hypothetical protein [Verrucomicrobiota bacterium JB023]